MYANRKGGSRHFVLGVWGAKGA